MCRDLLVPMESEGPGEPGEEGCKGFPGHPGPEVIPESKEKKVLCVCVHYLKGETCRTTWTINYLLMDLHTYHANVKHILPSHLLL